MSIAGLLIVAATGVVFIQAMNPAAAAGGYHAIGSPLTLSVITLPERTTTTVPRTTTTTKPSCRRHCPPPTTTTVPTTVPRTTTTTRPTTPPTTKPKRTPPTTAPTSPLLGGITPILGVATIQNAPGSTTTTTTASHPNGSVGPSKAKSAPVVGGVFNEPMVLASGGWKGLSLKAATNLKVPILFGVVVALFILGQALIDRRDPKLSRAPERNADDTVGFE